MAVGGHNGTILGEGSLSGSHLLVPERSFSSAEPLGWGEACHGRGAGFDAGLATTRT